MHCSKVISDPRAGLSSRNPPPDTTRDLSCRHDRGKNDKNFNLVDEISKKQVKKRLEEEGLEERKNLD